MQSNLDGQNLRSLTQKGGKRPEESLMALEGKKRFSTKIWKICSTLIRLVDEIGSAFALSGWLSKSKCFHPLEAATESGVSADSPRPNRKICEQVAAVTDAEPAEDLADAGRNGP